MSSLSSALAAFITSLRIEDMSSHVIHKAKLCLLDYLAAAWNAHEHELADAYTRYAFQLAGGTGRAHVIGEQNLLPPIWAAFVNAAKGHVTETDDGHRLSIMHIGTVVFPVVLALAEDKKLSGTTMLEAVICGYDLAIRAGQCFGPEHYAIFHTTGTAGTFGATAAAAKCLGLSRQETLWALGHAGTQATGLWQFLQDGAVRAKPFHPAKAAQNGIQAAQLAASGIEGASRIFEGEKGICAFAAQDPRFDLLIEGLGKKFRIEEVNFKAYPTCGQTHSVLDAATAILQRETISVQDIKRVEICIYQRAIDIAGIAQPENLEEARFSNQFCLAFLLVHGELTFANFHADAVHDKMVQELSKKVVLIFDEKMEAGFPASRPCKVDIHLLDGRVFSQENRFRRGDPESPMDVEDMSQKFDQLTSSLLLARQRRNIKQWVLDLPHRTSTEDFLFHIEK